MADIHIERAHALGFAKASELARSWSDGLADKLGVECTPVETDGVLRIDFVRSGVKGALTVEPEAFVFDARLGLLLGAFRTKIEAEVKASLDALASGHAPRTAVVRGDDLLT